MRRRTAATESLTWFCPHCWTTVPGHLKSCPDCGADIAAYSEIPYDEKLRNAFRHPIRGTRMIAIQAAGEKRIAGAVPELADIVRTDDDVYVVREALRALAAIGGVRAFRVVSEATQHASSVVRQFAKEI